MALISGIAIAALGAFLFAMAFGLIVVSARLLKMRLWEPVSCPVPRASAGDYLTILDSARELLEQEGFRYTHTCCVRPLIAADSDRHSYCDVYYNAVHDVHAEVYAAAMPTQQKVFDIYLWNYFVDGSALLTVNGLSHSLIQYPSTITVLDACTPDFKGQLTAHLSAREAVSIARIDPATILAVTQTMASKLLPDMEREGLVYRDGNCDGAPLYRFHLGAALKSAWRMRKGAMKMQAMEKRKRSNGNNAQLASPDAIMTAERIAFVRTLVMLRSLQAPRWFRWSALVLSAACFVAVGTWWWGVATALAIGAVIVVHEAGHWGAMKLARFRDVQVFFVPGMGGATSGEKHEAHPLTHLAVFLAGPVPGLLFAVAVLAWMAFGAGTQSEVISGLGVAAVAAFTVNMFNLLPVMPLDGGRIVDLFVLGRLPWLRFVFTLASTAMLMWWAIDTGDNVLRMLAILFLMATPHQYRMAKVSADLLRKRIATPEASEDFSKTAEKLYDIFAQPAYRKWNYRTKISLGHALLPRFLGRLPNAKETVLGMAIYVASITLPLVAIGLASMSGSGKVAQRLIGNFFYTSSDSSAARAKSDEENPVARLRRERQAQLVAASDLPARLEALRDAVEDANDASDDEDMLRLARLFYQETAHLEAPARERAQAARLLASAMRNADAGKNGSTEAGQLLSEAETILRTRLARRANKDDAFELAEVLQARAEEDDAKNELSRQREVVDIFSSYRQDAGNRLPEARIALARIFDRDGQVDEAEEALRKAEDDYRQFKGGEAEYGLTALTLDRAWFLLTHQRPDEAARMVEHNLAHASDASASYAYLRRDARLVKALAARMRGNWSEMKMQALAAWDLEPIKSGSKLSDFWIAHFAEQPKHDTRATLLLIDAERALGQSKDADALVEEVRRGFNASRRPYQGCRFISRDMGWRKVLYKTLGEIEARELKCS